MGNIEALPGSKSRHEVITDQIGTDLIVLRNQRGDKAKVSLPEGQITSWRNARGEEFLFTSAKITRSAKAMRGGIPVCFPQLGASASLEANGLTRSRGWTIDKDPPPLKQKDYQEISYIDLLLKPSENDLIRWPHSFEFRLRVCLASDGNLGMISRIRNIDSKPFSFSFGYHTYLSVSDISEVRIEGLENVDYLDNLCNGKRFTEQ